MGVGKLASSGVFTRPTKTLNCWKLLKLRVPVQILFVFGYESRNKFLRWYKVKS